MADSTYSDPATGMTFDTTDTVASGSDSLKPGVGNTVMADTVGVLYRAFTGKPDQWTQAEINDQAAQAAVAASNGTIDYDTAYQQAAQTTAAISNNPQSWWTTVSNWLDTNNLSWLPWAVGIAGVVFALWLVRPFVEAADE